MPSIFTKIIYKEIPCYLVAENEYAIAFLDISPLAVGHVLVVPKIEVDQLFDLDDNHYTKLWNFAKQVANAMKQVIDCKRIGVAVIGLEVPHAHIHLIPLQTAQDINFSKAKLKLDENTLSQIANKIAAVI
jgi:histidine triad (HIT) family protein